jgi:glycosyltransferase 2 family protein
VVDDPVFSVSEPAETAYVRSPVTAIRFVLSMAGLGVAYLLLRRADPAHFATLAGRALARAPHWLVSGVVGVFQLAVLTTSVLGFLGQLVLRRFTRTGRMLLAAIVCVVALILVAKYAGVGHLPLTPRGRRGLRGSSQPASSGRVLYGIGAAFPTSLDLGIIAACVFVDRAHWTERSRRVGLAMLSLAAFARFGVGLADPTMIVASLCVAASAALLVQLAFGIPNTRPTAAAVGLILGRFGYDVAAVEKFSGFSGFVGFRTRLTNDQTLFVKIVSRDAWATLFPVRLYHATRFRDTGRGQPFRALRTIVEHEALCALKAHSDGVPTARLAVVSEFPPASMMMAFESRPIQPLAQIDPSRRTLELQSSIWKVVAALHQSHTVHRNLNADALMVTDDGLVGVVGFGSASLGVIGPALSTDVAEVLAASAVTFGVNNAVQSAVDGIGMSAVTAALPRLQPLALTRSTRSAVKAADCLDDLRQEVERVTGVEAVPIAELERIKMRSVLTTGMVALAFWALIPQLVGFQSVWAELQKAQWGWAAIAVAFSVLTYIGAAIALDGSVVERLPFSPNLGAQLATSFVGVAAPGGSLALTARFLQKRGIDTVTAAAAVGVDAVAGLVVHITLLMLFVSLAGTSGLQTFNLPSLATVGLIVLAIALVAASSIAVPWTRTLLISRVLPAAKRSVANISEVARRPSKMTELFGGSLLITIGYLIALEAAVAALGTGPSFTSVALVYLVGSGIASVAPTPGGIGAIEATMIAGLTSAGMPSATAAAAVILFRLATFWLPLLPGWAAFALLRRSGDL